MGLGDPASNREPEAGPAGIALGARPCLVGTEETFENARLEFGGNSRPGVGDAQNVGICVEAAVYVDHSAGGRVFDGVVDEVQKHAAKEVFVGVEGKLRLNRGGERDTFGDGEGACAAQYIGGK